ncbi:kinase subunit of RNA polymerase II carboxy-terminal domain kinase I [Apophysomyces ossiformis]|uniref:Kinase subunit of RNA polymerase II carboxy-terminal domain kinase I n=1 Tax=Apophysomyces ossiformis TaxID=679940 RepID=A0A8H7BP06_9FUNG|nr:kinase subunit of RNA polymerase II carboxy-terminal domain kinase I [Apophysomyces ossiformis]
MERRSPTSKTESRGVSPSSKSTQPGSGYRRHSHDREYTSHRTSVSEHKGAGEKRSRDDYDHHRHRREEKRRSYGDDRGYENRSHRRKSRSYSEYSQSKRNDHAKQESTNEQRSSIPTAPKASDTSLTGAPPTAPAAFYQQQTWDYYGKPGEWSSNTSAWDYSYSSEQYQQHYAAYYGQQVPPPPPPPPPPSSSSSSQQQQQQQQSTSTDQTSSATTNYYHGYYHHASQNYYSHLSTPPPPTNAPSTASSQPSQPQPIETANKAEGEDIPAKQTTPRDDRELNRATSPKRTNHIGGVPEAVLDDVGYPFQTSDNPATLFEKIGQVGEGTYGKVYKARNCKTGRLMALKRIRMKSEKDGFPITAMREIKLLQQLKHDRIVELQQIMVSKGSVYMVLEYMDHDLSGILGHPNFKFEPAHAKSLVKQMLEGLGYLHNMGILHRDIKGSNLLINNKGELKIADFGLARVFAKNRAHDYTNRVITLWYRPPELLLGATAYGPAVDIWSVGCIMLEFFTGKPAFNGVDEISQLESIYKTMGTPTADNWATVSDLPWYELIRPKETYENKFKHMYEGFLSPGALELSEALLSMDPLKRPTATQALEFGYFTKEEPEPVPPANLLDMNGDWHEFESKQRKRQKATQNGQSKAVRPAVPVRASSSGVP